MTSPSLRSMATRVLPKFVAAARKWYPVTAIRHNSSHTASTSSSTPPPRPPPTLSAIASPTAPPKPVTRVKPIADTFFTARPSYISFLIQLEDLAHKTKHALEKTYVLEAKSRIPTHDDMLRYEQQLRQLRGPSAKVSLVAFSAVGASRRSPWLNRFDMQGILGIPLKTAQYRNIIARLSTLSKYSALVQLHLRPDDTWRHLAIQMENTIERFTRALDEGEGQGDGLISKTGVDELGRVWAVGKRKESTALVYIAPTSSRDPSAAGNSGQQSSVIVGEVQVNALSLSSYFTRQVHREQIVYPLRLTGLLGQFNVFFLVHGGGHSGQAGAAAHSLAKAIVRFFQEKYCVADATEGDSAESQKWKTLSESVREVLLRDGVFKRDPRMVERKKTGLAKARKAYTWVKR